MSTRDRLTLAAALAVALACSALAPLYDGTGWLPRTVGVVLLVAAVGAASRRAGLPAVGVVVVQLLAIGGYLAVAFAPGTFTALLPTGRTVTALRALADQAAIDVEQLAVPVPSEPALVLVAVAGAALVALTVDLLAVGLQRPALAGLPLLALLAVPSGLLAGGLGWLPFTLGAAGWLGLLLVEGADKVGRWGVPLRSGPTTSTAVDPDAGSTGRVGRRIGATALGVAAFLPALVPGLDARLLPGSGGDGDGGTGPATTVTYNPITELQGDLLLPEPRPVLRYRTDDPSPDYLRLTTLDVFEGSQWRSSSLTPDVDAEDGIPTPVGLTAATLTRDVTTAVEIDALDAQWLPVPPVPTSVEVRGPWNWNTSSETVFATRSSTRRIDSYEVRSLRPLPEQAQLASAGTTYPADIAPLALAPRVSRQVEALTRDVVSGADSAYEQAVALQEFFRGGNGFTYDVQTQNPFDNPDALEAFLIDSRQGFCEQYASAMAAMLRVLGIPARVGVGFTPGTPLPDGSFQVSTDDAHAWPEAWFDGVGWVRFEPTPVDTSREIVPPYTQEQAATPAPGSSAAPSAEPVPSSSAAPSGRDLDLQLDRGNDGSATGTAGSGDSVLPSGPVLVGGGLALLAVLPALTGLLRRRLRWRTDGPLTAWAQVRDDVTDTGRRWSGAETPRAAAARLGAELPAEARSALDRVVAGVERARYARPGSSLDGAWRTDADAVRAGLLSVATGTGRTRARVLPTSTLRWAASGAGRFVADVLDRVDDGFSAVGRRLRRRRAPA